MMPVQGHQLLAGEEPEPQKERHRWITQVLGQSRRGFQIGLLDNVRRVDPPLQPSIHPQRNHAPEPISVPYEEGPQSPRITAGRLLEQLIGRIRVAGHRKHRAESGLHRNQGSAHGVVQNGCLAGDILISHRRADTSPKRQRVSFNMRRPPRWYAGGAIRV